MNRHERRRRAVALRSRATGQTVILAKPEELGPEREAHAAERRRYRAQLVSQTRALLGRGQTVEAVLWVVTPAGAAVFLAKDFAADARASAELAELATVARQTPPEPGFIPCVHLTSDQRPFVEFV